MLKRLFLFLLIACCFGCDKMQQNSACGTQTCTLSFASLSIHFTDKNGNPVAIKNYSVVNQRTHLALTNTTAATANLMPGYYIVADDSSRSQLSTEGDDVLVSGTNPATNQTKTAIIKLSGGCNCHIAKVSGPDVIVFD